MVDFIERLKSKDTESNILHNQLPHVDSSQLNEMQLFAYNLVKYFLENKFSFQVYKTILKVLIC